YSLRAVVRPGITGWAQVRYGYANNLDEETEKMRYDLYYIKHLSLSFDLRILFDTVKTVLFGSESVDVDRPQAAETANEISTRRLLGVARGASRVWQQAFAIARRALPSSDGAMWGSRWRSSSPAAGTASSASIRTSTGSAPFRPASRAPRICRATICSR